MRNVWIDVYAPLVGRIFLGGFFLWNGIQIALDISGAAGVFAGHGLEYGLAWALVACLVEVLCGIAIVAGWMARPAALILAVYLIIQSAFATNFADGTELNLFIINLGLIGGLLYVAAYPTLNIPRR